MKTSKELRESTADLFARVEAITAVAPEEKRDLTPEEKAEVDGLMGAGDQPGKIAGMADVHGTGNTVHGRFNFFVSTGFKKHREFIILVYRYDEPFYG